MPNPKLLAAVPILLTTVRLGLGLAFPWLAAGWRLPALGVGGATEFLDGFLARRWRVESLAGQVFDPIADKVFVVAAFATLLAEGSIAGWQLALVVSRDLMVAAGAAWVAVRRGRGAVERMRPSWLGKWATAAQLALLVGIVVRGRTDWILFVPTAGLSLAAGWRYLAGFR